MWNRTRRAVAFFNLPFALCIFHFAFSFPLAAPPLWSAEPQRLTRDGRLKLDPQFVKNGEEIVYTAQEKFNQLSLRRLRLADGVIEPVHPGATTSEFGVSFSVGERQMAYVRNDGNLHVRLVIEDSANGTKVDYDPGGGFAGVQNTSLLPDGSRLLFAFPEKGGTQQLFAIGVDGKNRETLTKDEGFDMWPRVSPDGKSVAFASSRDGNFDIFVMNLDGRFLNRLTDHEGLDTHPAWSPNGRRIAYTSLRDGNYDIYVMNSDGSNPRRMTDNSENDDYPVWHPDGRRLVFVSERAGRNDLYLVESP